MSDSSPSSPLLPKAASVSFIMLMMIVALLAQIAIYYPSFRALPFGDDWGVPYAEILRGDRLGPLSFFTETRQPDSYRPVQSLLMWLFGRVDEPLRWVSIRILHLLCSGVLLASLGLMLHAFRIGKGGVIAGMLVGALHPTLVAPVASIDGFSSTLSCAFIWFGVWAMYATRDRLWLSVTLAALMLIAGTLVKEYAFALTPMAVLTAWIFFNKRRSSAIVTAIVLGILTALLLWVRQFAKPTDIPITEPDFEVDSLKTIVQNIALVFVGGLFFGDSLALYVERSKLIIAVSGLIFALTIFYLVAGWWRRLHAEPAETDRRLSCVLLFLLLSFGAVTFPANVVMRISEMYLPGLVVNVALLIAFAADGWGRKRDGLAASAWLVLFCLLVTSCFANWHKAAGMMQMGELAKLQSDQLVAIVKHAPEAKHIKLLYRKDQLPERATFSSYRLADCYLVRPTANEILFPGRALTIDCVPPLPDEAAVRAADRSDADLVLYWDVEQARYERLK